MPWVRITPNGEGRSPRVRGRPRAAYRRGRPRGSIPAGAGETATPRKTDADRGVDPRGCGGDELCGEAFRKGVGRSPRVRGRQAWRSTGTTSAGSIPAGAGETSRMWCCPPRRRVDPRGCGGDHPTCWSKSTRAGRSPRVRGRRPRVRRLVDRRGSIPAGAGETYGLASSSIRARVDPRGCGGDEHQGAAPCPDKGRSPRVRGRPVACARHADAPRSIPAGAGETRAGSIGASAPRVDPRGCGGDASKVSGPMRCWGRSPRVRGRPQDALRPE